MHPKNINKLWTTDPLRFDKDMDCTIMGEYDRHRMCIVKITSDEFLTNTRHGQFQFSDKRIKIAFYSSGIDTAYSLMNLNSDSTFEAYTD